MNNDKDYYAILGVLPSAEEIVIKAAYRALSKRYHPDVYTGPNLAEKMADINEAYETLSNAAMKSEYDTARGVRSQDADEYFNDDFGTHNTVDPLDADWKVAIKYHPELEDAVAKLTKYSKKLAYAYKAYMLEVKDFSNIHKTAKALADEFLELHFGKNEQIISFAKALFSDRRTDMLLELNQAIKVLGVKNADKRIIPKIKKEYGYFTPRQRFADFMKSVNKQDIYFGQEQTDGLFKIWTSNPDKARRAALDYITEANESDKNQNKSFVVAIVIILIAFFVLIGISGS